MRKKKAHTSKKWRISIKVRHGSGIFKRPSIQHFIFTSQRPITGFTAIKRFKKMHPHGSTVGFEPRTPRQKHACRVYGCTGTVDYSRGTGVSAHII